MSRLLKANERECKLCKGDMVGKKATRTFCSRACYNDSQRLPWSKDYAKNLKEFTTGELTNKMTFQRWQDDRVDCRTCVGSYWCNYHEKMYDERVKPFLSESRIRIIMERKGA